MGYGAAKAVDREVSMKNREGRMVCGVSGSKTGQDKTEAEQSRVVGEKQKSAARCLIRVLTSRHMLNPTS